MSSQQDPRISAQNASQRDGALIRHGLLVVGFFFAATIVARLGREMAIAFRYGVGPEVDAYVFLFTLANWPVSVWFSVLTVVLIPLAAGAVRSEPTELRLFRRELLGLTLLLALGLTVLLGGSVALGAGTWTTFLPAKVAARSTELLPALLPILPLGVLAGLFSTWVMAAGRHLNTLMEGVPPLFVILSVLLFPDAGMDALVYGTVAGFLAQLLGLVLFQWLNDEVEAPLFSFTSEHWAPFRRGFGVMLAGQLVMAFTIVIDQISAATLPAGALAELGYALRMWTVATGLVGLVISRATLPVFSGRIASDPVAVRAAALRLSTLLLGLGFAGSLIAWVLAPQAVKLLFERGAFDSADTWGVAQVFRFGLFQFPGYFAGLVLVSYLSSAKKYASIALSGPVGFVVKILSVLLLVPKFGVIGVALSTSAMYTATFLFLFWKVRREIPTPTG